MLLTATNWVECHSKRGMGEDTKLSLAKECYAMKLDLFTNATVVDYGKKTNPKSSHMS